MILNIDLGKEERGGIFLTKLQQHVRNLRFARAVHNNFCQDCSFKVTKRSVTDQKLCTDRFALCLSVNSPLHQSLQQPPSHLHRPRVEITTLRQESFSSLTLPRTVKIHLYFHENTVFYAFLTNMPGSPGRPVSPRSPFSPSSPCSPEGPSKPSAP